MTTIEFNEKALELIGGILHNAESFTVTCTPIFEDALDFCDCENVKIHQRIVGSRYSIICDVPNKTPICDGDTRSDKP